VLGHHGEGAVAVLVPGEMDEGIVHGRDQIESLPQAQLAHVGGEELDVGKTAQLAAGLREQLEAELGGDYPRRLLREEPRGSAGARAQLQDAASRTLARHADPEGAVPPAAQLGVEEGEDAMIIVLDFGGHAAGM
jgi:hypothetical protein